MALEMGFLKEYCVGWCQISLDLKYLLALQDDVAIIKTKASFYQTKALIINFISLEELLRE